MLMYMYVSICIVTYKYIYIFTCAANFKVYLKGTKFEVKARGSQAFRLGGVGMTWGGCFSFQCLGVETLG